MPKILSDFFIKKNINIIKSNDNFLMIFLITFWEI